MVLKFKKSLFFVKLVSLVYDKSQMPLIKLDFCFARVAQVFNINFKFLCFSLRYESQEKNITFEIKQVYIYDDLRNNKLISLYICRKM